MNNNKQIDLSIQRIKRLRSSYGKCHKNLTKLMNKKVNTSFESKQIKFFNHRLTQIRVSFYMEGIPSC